MTNTKMLATKELLLDLDHFLSKTFWLKVRDFKTNEQFWYKFSGMKHFDFSMSYGILFRNSLYFY